jgi:FkbM family methyltransferase
MGLDHNDIAVINYLKDRLTPGSIFVDIGSNYGEYTGFFKSILNGTGKIYSVELDPTTFESLKSNFKDDTNIVFVNKAISNKDSIIDYYQGNDAWTNNIIGHDTSFNGNSKKGTIESITLDTLLKDEPKIDFIKIDVEGADLLVLEGMKKTIKKTKSFLLECHFDKDWEQIKQILLIDNDLDCIDLITKEKVTMKSNRVYQCFCSHK